MKDLLLSQKKHIHLLENKKDESNSGGLLKKLIECVSKYLYQHVSTISGQIFIRYWVRKQQL